MRSYVHKKLRGKVEGFRTLQTTVWFFSSLSLRMLFQLACRSKRLSAVNTIVPVPFMFSMKSRVAKVEHFLHTGQLNNFSLL